MTKAILRRISMATVALAFVAAIGLAHDPKKKGTTAGEGMHEACEQHHSAAMRATDALTAHLAEAKRSTTVGEMRAHVEAAEKALAQMKSHVSECMEMMGGEHGHKMHGGSAASDTAPSGAKAKAVDPVCGMEVDPATAPSATYNGKTYYFCSAEDEAKFEKNPEKYVKK